MTEPLVAGQTFGPIVRGTLPEWTVPVVLLITRVGNVAVFLVLFAVDYWFFDHERGAHAISLIIGGMALITALKFFFAVPRPPEEVTVIPTGGFSFPSGHATGATIAYGALAYDLDVGSWKSRFGVASVLVALVALSRVVLGVHFLRDVVAGILFGAGFLVAAFALTKHAPRPGFLLAIGLGAVAFAVSGASHDATAVLGAALGAALAWEFLDDVPAVESRAARIALIGVVLPALAGIGYLSLRSSLPLAAVFALNAALLAGLIAAPLVEYPFERLSDERRPHAR